MKAERVDEVLHEPLRGERLGNRLEKTFGPVTVEGIACASNEASAPRRQSFGRVSEASQNPVPSEPFFVTGPPSLYQLETARDRIAQSELEGALVLPQGGLPVVLEQNQHDHQRCVGLPQAVV